MKPTRRNVKLRRRTDQGGTLVFVVVALVALFGIMSLATDWAILFMTRRSLQAHADASALAGAFELPDAGHAQFESTRFYSLNVSMDAPPAPALTTCDGADPNTVCYNIGNETVQITTPYTNSVPGVAAPADKVIHVKACKNVDYVFGRLFGFKSVEVCAQATAVRYVSAAGILVLDPTGDKALDMSGGANLNLPTGDVVVNSSSQVAFNISGGGSGITANEIRITGNYNASGGSQSNLHPPPSIGQSATADPLASLPAPSTTGLPVFPNVKVSSTTAVLQPGVYTTPLVISSSTVTFNPGIYILQGGITASGGSTLIGNGVMLYNGGQLTISGGGSIQLTPPDSGPYQGVTVFQARGNTAKATLSGGSGSIFAGSYYFPDTQLLELSGASNLKLGAVITWRMLLSGGSFESGPVNSPTSGSIALVE